jgi:hypothetical protein
MFGGNMQLCVNNVCKSCMYCSATRLLNNLNLNIPQKFYKTEETDLQQ